MNPELLGHRYTTFGSERYPVSNDTKLWRYLSFEKFLSMMETSSLYHARLDQMSDLFEGSVTKPFVARRRPVNPQGNQTFSEYDPSINKHLKAISFVSCWHASEVESDAMWKLYSRENAGVAIMTTFQLMQDAVTLPAETDHGILGPVEYLDFETDDMVLKMGSRVPVGFAKRKSFEHEKEVRGLIRIRYEVADPNNMLSDAHIEDLKAKLPRGVSAKVNLKNLIVKIHISPLAQGWFEDLVKNAALRAGLSEIVHKSNLIGEPVY